MRVGRWGETALEMHPAFPALCALLVATGQGGILAVMLLSLMLHELGHVVAALALGIRVSGMELMPFGGAARLEGWRQLPAWQASLVALAGPAINLLLAMGAIFAVHYNLFAVGEVALFVRCNLILMLFNLLPALPMDGGRLGSACLSGLLGEQRALRLFAALGALLGGGVLALGVWGVRYGLYNPTLFLTGSYLIYAALRERNTPAYTQLHRSLLNRTRLEARGALPARHWVVRSDVPLERLAGKLSANCYHRFDVVDDNLRALGSLDEPALLRGLLDRPDKTVGETLAER